MPMPGLGPVRGVVLRPFVAFQVELSPHGAAAVEVGDDPPTPARGEEGIDAFGDAGMLGMGVVVHDRNARSLAAQVEAARDTGELRTCVSQDRELMPELEAHCNRGHGIADIEQARQTKVNRAQPPKFWPMSTTYTPAAGSVIRTGFTEAVTRMGGRGCA